MKNSYVLKTEHIGEYRWLAFLSMPDEWCVTAEGNSEYLAIATVVFRTFHLFLKDHSEDR